MSSLDLETDYLQAHIMTVFHQDPGSMQPPGNVMEYHSSKLYRIVVGVEMNVWFIN